MIAIMFRFLFALVVAAIGYQLGGIIGTTQQSQIAGAGLGALLASLIILGEVILRRVSSSGLLAGLLGLLAGLLVSTLISDIIVLVPMPQIAATLVRISVTLVFSYVLVSMAIRGRENFNLVIPYVTFSHASEGSGMTLLDTSVIIDGRIADISRTNFLEGKLIVPKFVLRELQMIGDSADSLKRTRGRRGLDILNKIQTSGHVDVRIHEEDFPEIPEVDGKLVKLAKRLDAKIFTNDYNLSRIAELQGVRILNINELAESLRPVVLPGERMTVKPVKEGKEFGQGVAYLEDGTMVVVDAGKDLIGRHISVVITSVLQTSAGRMIFAKPQAANQPVQSAT